MQLFPPFKAITCSSVMMFAMHSFLINLVQQLVTLGLHEIYITLSLILESECLPTLAEVSVS